MFYDAVENDHGLPRDPFKGLIMPRPIGWISSISAAGVVNLAPYSFFNAVSEAPHIVMFSSGGRKDTIANIEATGEFVCNLATYELREAMNLTSARAGPEVDEMALAGLEAAPSHFVKVPRVAASPVALECRYLQTVEMPLKSESGNGSFVVFGQVVGIYIDDEMLVDGRVDAQRLQAISRLGYRDYGLVDSVFSIDLPKAQD